MIKNLKLLRSRKGISQGVLGAAIGVSQQSINKYGNQDVEPNLALLSTLADYFNVTIDYLVGREDEADSFHAAVLPEDEIFLLASYRKLSSAQKHALQFQADYYLIENRRAKQKKDKLNRMQSSNSTSV